jgi:hypothetical protein
MLWYQSFICNPLQSIDVIHRQHIALTKIQKVPLPAMLELWHTQAHTQTVIPAQTGMTGNVLHLSLYSLDTAIRNIV